MKLTDVVVHSPTRVTATRTGFWFNLFKGVFGWREDYEWVRREVGYIDEWYLLPERTRVGFSTYYWLEHLVEDRQVWGSGDNGNS